MSGEDIEHHQAVFHPAARRNLMAQHDFFTIVMRPLIEELSHLAPISVSCHPNAGLPNPLLPTGFQRHPIAWRLN